MRGDEPRRTPLVFLASAAKDLRKLPQTAQDGLGLAFEALSLGAEPADFNPMKGVGEGLSEVRLRDRGNAYRAAYVARFEEAIYASYTSGRRGLRRRHAPASISSAPASRPSCSSGSEQPHQTAAPCGGAPPHR